MKALISILSQVDVSFLPRVGDNNDSPIKVALQFVFALLGAIAVLIIAIASLRFVLSRGEPQAVAKAKNTIIYAVVGLIISIAAYSIVSFVIRQF